jgi:hypothetical protein
MYRVNPSKEDEVRKHRCTGLTVALTGLVCATAWAASNNAVVGPAGKAAGGGYAHWLAVRNRLLFTTPASGSPVCSTQHGPRGVIAFLAGGGRGKPEFSCNEPVGRPIYIAGLTNECSTIKGDHKGYGTSDAQLRRCARHGYKGLSASARLDGAPVTDYHKLIATAPAIAFRLSKNNPFGLKPQSGRSVAYGEGLLLSDLRAGTHTVRISETFPAPNQGSDNIVTYRLHIGEKR